MKTAGMGIKNKYNNFLLYGGEKNKPVSVKPMEGQMLTGMSLKNTINTLLVLK